MTSGDRRKARLMFWGSTVGHATSIALYFANAITERQLLGLTLSLS